MYSSSSEACLYIFVKHSFFSAVSLTCPEWISLAFFSVFYDNICLCFIFPSPIYS